MISRPRFSRTGIATAVACFVLTACSTAPEEPLTTEASPPLPARDAQEATGPEHLQLDGQSRSLPAMRTVGHFEGWVDPLTGEAHVSMVHPGQKSAALPGFRDDLRQNRDEGDFGSVRAGTLRFQQDESGNGSDDEECQAFWLAGWAPDWRFGYIPASMPLAREAFFTLLATGGPGSAEVSGGNRFCTNFQVRNDKADAVRDLWILIDFFSLSGVRSYVDAAPRTVQIGPGEFETLDPYSPIGMFNYGQLEPGEVANRQWYFYLGSTDPQPFTLRGRLVELLREDCTTETDDNNDGFVNSGCRQFDLGDPCVIDDDCASLWCNPATDLCDLFDCDPGDGCVAPIVETDAPTGVTDSGATLRGTLVEQGEPPVIARGFCYGDVPAPAHGVDEVTCTQVGGEEPPAGAYSLILDELDPGQRVRYTAWAQGLDMMRYGAVEEFVIAPSPVTTLTVINVTHEGAELTWDPADGATGYRIYRDGVFLEEVNDTTWTVQGLAAPPTAAPTGLSATTDRQGEVRLSWDEPDEPQTGPVRDFGVRAVAYATPSDLGPVSVSVARAAYTLNGFRIERNIGGDVETFIVDVGESTFDDDTAPAPTLLAPTAFDATDGTELGSVGITATVPRPVPGDTALYRIRQVYAEAVMSDFSAPVAGQRDFEAVTLDRERGSAPSAAAMTSLLESTVEAVHFGGGETTWTTQDNEATPVEERWYRLVVSGDGLTSVSSVFTSGIPGAAAVPVLTSAIPSPSSPSVTLAGALPPAAPVPATVTACWRATGGGTWFCGAESPEISGPLTATLTGLPHGTRVDLVFRATHLHGTFDSNVIGNVLTVPSGPAGVSASQGLHSAHVTVQWTSNAPQEITSYVISRNGTDIATLPGPQPPGIVDYQDSGAPAGEVGNIVAVNVNPGHESIQIAWDEPTLSPGASRTYAVRAVNDTGSATSNTVAGWRGPPVLEGYQLTFSQGASTYFSQLVGPTPRSFTDNNAPGAEIVPGSVTASDGTSTAHVTVSASGTSVTPAPLVNLCVRSVRFDGEPTPLASCADAMRSHGPLAYTYEVSADGGTTFSTLATDIASSTFNDTEAPSDGTEQLYAVTVSADGAENSPVLAGSDTGFRGVPVGWTTFTTGYRMACGVRSDGRAYCWGTPESGGQIGGGGQSCVPREVNGNYTDWFDVACSELHCCGLRGDSETGGTAWCWGTTAGGRQGHVSPSSNVSAVDSAPPLTVPDNFVRIATGDGISCAVTATEELWCWGTETTFCSSTTAAPCDAGNSYINVAGSKLNTMFAQRADGTWMGWGNNRHFGLLRPNQWTSNAPLAPLGGGHEFEAIYKHMDHHQFCGRVAETNRVYCWGRNHHWQTQHPSKTESVSDFANEPYEVPGEWGGFGSGGDASCVWGPLTEPEQDQTLHCWGLNNAGQLGLPIGSPFDRREILPMPTWWGAEVTRVEGGWLFLCALDVEGDLYCWGSNQGSGSLGDGECNGSRNVPARIMP